MRSSAALTVDLYRALAVILLLAALPHLARLPVYFAGIWLGLLGWRLALVSRHASRRRPPGWQRLLVAVAVILLLLVHFQTLFGRDAGAGFLVFLTVLKYLEMHHERDAQLVIFLSFFLVASAFFFDQAIHTGIYLLAVAWGITTVWLRLSDKRRRQPLRVQLRASGRMLLLAVPIMLVLFILFPRLPGPLWSLPSDAHTGVTGLSETLQPGQFSSLVSSQAVAFRANFEGQPPPPEQRYWRGPVMDLTDGRRWSSHTVAPERRIAATAEAMQHLQPQGEGLRHTITLEPNNKTHLPALDVPGSVPAGGYLRPDYQLRADSRIRERRRYRVTSYRQPRFSRLSPAYAELTSMYPADTTARMRDLAGDFRRRAETPRDIVDAALLYFNEQPFVYTLKPPLLGRSPMDEFLFETRRGFCEHYAAAFTLLMRLAGLPARVVTGYLGGEYNPVGNYLIVRQSDAHAWSEVWLPQTGWTRVDPTSAIAPQRIENRIDPASAASDAVAYVLDADHGLVRLLKQARHLWDTANNGWNQWVLSYGPQRQRDLLAGLGLPDVSWRGLGLTLGLSLAVLLAILSWWVLRLRSPDSDPARRLYARFRRRLQRRGIVPRPGETPLQLLARLRSENPALAGSAGAIVHDYVQLRYAPDADPDALKRLRRSIRNFK